MLKSRVIDNMRTFLLGVVTIAMAAPQTKDPAFATDVQPLLQAKCVGCHGAAPQAKLDLRTSEGVLKGGASGPVVVPGIAEKSLIIAKVVTGQMPPGKTKLTSTEIDLIRGWIDRTLPAEVKIGEPLVTERQALAVLQARCVGAMVASPKKAASTCERWRAD